MMATESAAPPPASAFTVWHLFHGLKDFFVGDDASCGIVLGCVLCLLALMFWRKATRWAKPAFAFITGLPAFCERIDAKLDRKECNPGFDPYGCAIPRVQGFSGVSPFSRIDQFAGTPTCAWNCAPSFVSPMFVPIGVSNPMPLGVANLGESGASPIDSGRAGESQSGEVPRKTRSKRRCGKRSSSSSSSSSSSKACRKRTPKETEENDKKGTSAIQIFCSVIELLISIVEFFDRLRQRKRGFGPTLPPYHHFDQNRAPPFPGPRPGGPFPAPHERYGQFNASEAPQTKQQPERDFWNGMHTVANNDPIPERSTEPAVGPTDFDSCEGSLCGEPRDPLDDEFASACLSPNPISPPSEQCPGQEFGVNPPCMHNEAQPLQPTKPTNDKPSIL